MVLHEERVLNDARLLREHNVDPAPFIAAESTYNHPAIAVALLLLCLPLCAAGWMLGMISPSDFGPVSPIGSHWAYKAVVWGMLPMTAAACVGIAIQLLHGYRRARRVLARYYAMLERFEQEPASGNIFWGRAIRRARSKQPDLSPPS